MFLSRLEKETIDKGTTSEGNDGKELKSNFNRLEKAYEDPLTDVHLHLMSDSFYKLQFVLAKK